MSKKKEPLIPPSEASPEDALRAFMKVERLLPSLGERDQRDPAEPELAAPAACLPGGRLSRDRRSIRAKRGPVEHQLP